MDRHPTNWEVLNFFYSRLSSIFHVYEVVSLQVSLQADVVIEHLVAMMAAVRLLSGVDAEVPVHVAFLGEPASAKRARVALLLRVRGNMLLKSDVGLKRFPAVLADVVPGLVVEWAVYAQCLHGPECPVAEVACVRHHASPVNLVVPDVGLQLLVACKSLPAILADVVFHHVRLKVCFNVLDKLIAFRTALVHYRQLLDVDFADLLIQGQVNLNVSEARLPVLLDHVFVSVWYVNWQVCGDGVHPEVFGLLTLLPARPTREHLGKVLVLYLFQPFVEYHCLPKAEK